MKPIPIQPTPFRRSLELGDFRGTECPICKGYMEIHQPDAGRPERLLGTCGDCSIWCLVDLSNDVTMILFDTQVSEENEPKLSLVRAE